MATGCPSARCTPRWTVLPRRPGPSSLPDLVGAEQSTAGPRPVGDADRIRRRHRPAERRHVLPPVFGGLREGASHSHVQPHRQPGKDRAQRRRRFGQVGRHHRHRIGSLERQSPAHQLEQQDAERIHVRSGVDDAAGELLWRRVSHGADELLRPCEARLVAALPYGGDAEIDDLVDSLAAGEVVRDDVGRLQVAVNDVARMRQRQRRAHRRQDPLHVLEGQPDTLRQFILQARPAEQFHHQERALRVVGVVVEDRDDVRMAQLRTGAALADEPFERRGTLHIREDHLDRHVVAEKDPARTIHRAHAPLG